MFPYIPLYFSFSVFFVEEFRLSVCLLFFLEIVQTPPPLSLEKNTIHPLDSLPSSLKSSTTIIPLSSSGGVLLMTLCTVRRRTDRRSLWKQIMTVVVGSLAGYVLCLALQLFEQELQKGKETFIRHNVLFQNMSLISPHGLGFPRRKGAGGCKNFKEMSEA